ncbi:hypothetical protein [Actinosynnema sp. NPDC023587]|uniref:hypothetical protein n=1 Tax=Actinosynnema sp. NPDC023587 TaxID=3154695 RepID=UPI0033DA3B60
MDQPELISRVRADLWSEHGFFLIRADEGEMGHPLPEFFDHPLPLCGVVADAVFFLDYTGLQSVDCDVESWSGPPAEPDGYEEQAEVEVVLSTPTFSLCGPFDEGVEGIALARAGKQHLRVHCTGRDEARRRYQADPTADLAGVEHWRIQIWPA